MARAFVAAVLAALLVLVAGAAGTATAPAAGSTNGLASVYVSPSDVTTAPGEQFQVDVMIDSQPQFASGMYFAEVTVAYDPAYVEVTDVQPGGYMAGGEETTVRTTTERVDDDNGTVTLGRERDPPRGGVDGEGAFATLTFAVHEDAPAGSFRVDPVDATLVLTDDGSQRIVNVSASVTVGGTTDDGGTDAGPATGTPTGEQPGDGFGPAGLSLPVLAIVGVVAVAVGTWLLRRL